MEYNDYMLKAKTCAERMKTLREEQKSVEEDASNNE